MASFQDILRGLKDVDTGALETATALGTGMIATPIAGVRGVAGWVDEMVRGSRRPGEAYKRALDLIERTQQGMTYAPRTDLGRRGVENVGKALHAITDPIERATTDKLAEAGAPGLAAGVVGVAGVLDPSKGAGRAKGAIEAAASAAARAAKPKPGFKPGVTEGEAAARQMVAESGLGLAEKPPAPRTDPGSTQALIPGVEPLTPQEALRSAEAARARAVERASFTDPQAEVRYTYDPESSRQYTPEFKGESRGESVSGRGDPSLYEFGIDPRLGTVRGPQIYTRAGALLAQDPLAFMGGPGGRPDLAARLRSKAEGVAEAERDVAARQGDVVRAEEVDPQRALIEQLRGQREGVAADPQARDVLESRIFREKRELPVVDEEGRVWEGEQRGGSGVPGSMMYRERGGGGGQVRGDELADFPPIAEHQAMMHAQGEIAQGARRELQDFLRANAVADAERAIPRNWEAIDRMRAQRGQGTPMQAMERERDILAAKEEMPQIHEGNAWQRSGYYYEPVVPGTDARNIRTREAPRGSSLASHGELLERQNQILDQATLDAARAAREADAQAAIGRGSELEETIAALRERRDPAMSAREALELERDIIGRKYEVPVVDRTENIIYTPHATRRGPTFERRDRSGRVDPGDFDDPLANTDAQNLVDRIEASQGLISGLEQEAARARAAQLQARAERVLGMGDPNDVTDALRRSRIRRDLIAREPVVQEGEVWRGTPLADQMRYHDAPDRNTNYERFTSPGDSPMGEHARRYAEAQRETVANTRTRNAVVEFLNDIAEQERANAPTTPPWAERLTMAPTERGNVPLGSEAAPRARAPQFADENWWYDALGIKRPMPRLTQRPAFGDRDPNAMNREAVDAFIEAVRADPERTLQYGAAAPRAIARDIDALADYWTNKRQLKGREIEHRWDDDDDAGMLVYPDTDANITYDFNDPRGVAIHSTEVGSGTGKKEGAGGGAALYQLLLENLRATGQTSYPTTGLTGINQLRILSNVIPDMLRGGENVRNLRGTASGRADEVSGISQDLPAILRAETEEIATRTRRQGAPERKLWFDGENLRLGDDVASEADIRAQIKQLSPRPDITGVGQKSLQRAAIFDYIRALPAGQPIDKAAMKKMIESFVTQYGPIASLGGAAAGIGAMQDTLRDTA